MNFVQAVPTLLLGLILLNKTMTWPFWVLVGLVALLLLTESVFLGHAFVRKVLHDSTLYNLYATYTIPIPPAQSPKNHMHFTH